MIAILCPTRGRPEQFRRMYQSARSDLSTTLFSNDNEEAYRDIVELSYNEPNHLAYFQTPDMLPTAHKWNYLADTAMSWPRYRLFMLGADDMYFETPGWDKALIDHYNALENKIHVYALQDSRDENGTPHIIVTREYIEAMGYFVPPIFLHWFVDSWSVSIARANNCFTHLKDYKLVHDKPSDSGKPDETHSRIREWGWHERDKYVNDTCQHFLRLEKQRLYEVIWGTDLTQSALESVK